MGKNGKKPLPIKFDPSVNQFKAIGDNASMFVRCISNEIDASAPFHIRYWREVSRGYKLRLQKMLHPFFDLRSLHQNEHWEGINEGIMKDCASRFTDRRSKLKLHFDAVGGYEDIEEAKNNPQDHISLERWHDVIDLFLTQEYRDSSERNKANRAKQKYPSYHGSKSYVQRRNEEKEATGSANYIDGWRSMHSRNSVFVNVHAQNDWNKIEEERNRALASLGEGEEIDQVQVLQKSLGTRRGHERGVGRKVKSVTPDVSRTFYEPPPEQNDLHQMVLQQQETIAALQAQVNQIISNLGGSSTQQHQEDGEEEEHD